MDHQTHCTCCHRQHQRQGPYLWRMAVLALLPCQCIGTLAMMTQGRGACRACQWCYSIVKITLPPHHNRLQASLSPKHHWHCRAAATQGCEPHDPRGQGLAGWATRVVDHLSTVTTQFPLPALLLGVKQCIIHKRSTPADVVWAQLPLIQLERVAPLKAVRCRCISGALRWSSGRPPGCL